MDRSHSSTRCRSRSRSSPDCALVLNHYAAPVSRGVIALLGSGETAPGMTRVHRSLLARYPRARAVLLDTTYGFQENREQMSEKLVDYFATSLQTPLEVASLPRYDAASELERALVARRIEAADYVFAGPGSPSYALAQWRPFALADHLASALERGATLCFSSAATLTLGAATAPIYEVYKAGDDPFWLEGLDLLGRYGLRCAVIPHWDNREGRDYDTSRCYLGERRLSLLESTLPEDVAILGVDEHTAAVIDLEERTIRATGRGHAYWRRGSSIITIAADTTPITVLASEVARTTAECAEPETAPITTPIATARDLAERARAGDLAALAALVERAGTTTSTPPAALVDAALAARDALRTRGDFALADRVRDALAAAGVEVRDEASGTSWSMDGSGAKGGVGG